jgi:ferric-dicitrate binding protein FerR (iron transport regulator)
MQQAMLQQWHTERTVQPVAETGRRIYKGIERRLEKNVEAHRRLLSGWQRYVAVAAVFAGLIVCGAGYLLWQNVFQSHTQMVEITATQSMHYILPDSSTVWMTPGSTLRFAEAFRNKRDVQLTGSATFDVVKDAAHPFTVQIRRASIEVKGTAFQVNYQADTDRYNIALFHGKIDFVAENTGLRTALLPSQTLSYNPQNGDTQTGRLPGFTWQDGRFSFSNIPLGALIRSVNQLYDADIRINANISPEITFNGSIRVDETIDEITSKVCFILNLQKENIDDKTIILR